MKSSNIIASVLGVIIKVLVTVLVIVVIYRGAEICFNYGYRIFMETPMAEGEDAGKSVTVTITAEMSPKEIGALFVSKGLIRDENLFVLQYYLSEFVKDVGPGTFELSTAMTVEEMMESMADALEEQKSQTAEKAS